MSEAIYKLQPNRTIQLRACDDRGAAACIHSATASGFTVSGVFRDLADVAVLDLWKADNFFEHPRLKHLPDWEFAGVTLEFDVQYTGLADLNSVWYEYARWKFLGVTYKDGSSAEILLRDCGELLWDVGGVTRWHITLDFSSSHFASSQIDKLWLVFAPAIVPAGPQRDVEWEAKFTNWTVAGANRALQVAGPGSVRLEETDAWAVYTGFWEWAPTQFWSQGRAKRAAAAGAMVTVETHCQYTHDVYVGTRLDYNCGIVEARLDGAGAWVPLDCYAAGADARQVRRLLFAGVAAGGHSVEIRLTATKNETAPSAGWYFYFDFLECAVLSDVPAAAAEIVGVSAALDWDTEHSYKLPAARVLWAMDNLGYRSRLNLYTGVFFWNQRKRVGGDMQLSTVTFSGTVGSNFSAALVFARPAPAGPFRIWCPGTNSEGIYADSPEHVAFLFALEINRTSTVFWAEARGPVLTLHGRSTGKFWRDPPSLEVHDANTESGGLALLSGSVTNENLWFTTGQWQVDPAQTPALSRAARDWHRDLFAECVARGLEITVAFSMELFNTPDAAGDVWAARFPNGTKVLTSTGFGVESPCGIKSVASGAPVIVEVPKHDYDTGDSIGILGTFSDGAAWPVTKIDADHFSLDGSNATGSYDAGGTAYRNLRTTHCSFVTAMRDYQARAYVEMADLMAAAGLAPRLQFGEFTWWYFAADAGMAFSDAETRAAFLAANGREMHTFLTANDDPYAHKVDADFLRARLVAHMTAIRDRVKAAHANAEIEVLLPFDVNYPEVYGPYGLGGRLLHYVNIPNEFRDPATAPFDAIKMEGLDFGSGSRDLDKARRAAWWPSAEQRWPRDKCRYVMPVFNAGCPWGNELAATRGAGAEVVLWAWDHVCLFGWGVAAVPRPGAQVV